MALVLAYVAGAAAAPSQARDVTRKVAGALLLALLSVSLSRWLANTVVTPVTWDHLFYLKLVIPPIMVVFWCAALMPRETRSLARRLHSSPALAPLPQLALLLGASAAMVSVGDLAFEWSGTSAAGMTLKAEIISREAWTANVLVVFGGYMVVLALTRRVWFALLLVSALYPALCVATLLKIRYMHSAVHPLDLLRLGELWPYARDFAGPALLLAILAVLGLWGGILLAATRLAPAPLPALRRWSTGLLGMVCLLAFPIAYLSSSVSDDGRQSLSWADELLNRFKVRGRDFKEMARLRGFLMSFLSQLPGALVAMPPAYSPAAVASALARHCGPATPVERRGRVNLVVLLVESFMDPHDLGLHYTRDPIPHIRSLRQSHIGGYGIVPEDFGGSANTEFEALTGMATAFLPQGSVAYRLYLTRPIPSLPGALRALGYATTAVQADPKHFYGREEAYRLLGFERVIWLGDDPGVDRDARGWWPSDSAVVEAVIEASRGVQPFFIFAFLSATHFPYNQGTYQRSSLDVLGTASPDVTADVKEYINALHTTDRQIKALVEHFRRRPDSTIIAVLGDHLPPLPEGALRSFFSVGSRKTPHERALMRRRVPLLVWSNFSVPRSQQYLSVNALPTFLLSTMGIVPSGFLGVSDMVRRRVPVLSEFVQTADGTVWNRDALPGTEKRLIDDYRLLQYDLLLGERHALVDGTSMESACEAGAT